jgi:hypothetical protein
MSSVQSNGGNDMLDQYETIILAACWKRTGFITELEKLLDLLVLKKKKVVIVGILATYEKSIKACSSSDDKTECNRHLMCKDLSTHKKNVSLKRLAAARSNIWYWDM